MHVCFISSGGFFVCFILLVLNNKKKGLIEEEIVAHTFQVPHSKLSHESWSLGQRSTEHHYGNNLEPPDESFFCF